MRSIMQRLAIVTVAAFAVFGLHGVAIAAPDGACAEVARHHGHVIDVDDAEVVAAGFGISTAGEGVAIPLAILVSGFLLAVIRRTWGTVPSRAGQRTYRQVGDGSGRSPPLRSQLSVWRI
jgi:hypothetical protein